MKVSEVLEKVEEVEGKFAVISGKVGGAITLLRYLVEYVEYVKASQKGTVLVKPPKLPEDYEALKKLAFKQEEEPADED
jgi:hypothetical protein